MDLCNLFEQRNRYGQIIDEIILSFENYLTMPSLHACPYFGKSYLKDFPISSKIISSTILPNVNFVSYIRFFDDMNRTILHPKINGIMQVKY